MIQPQNPDQWIEDLIADRKRLREENVAQAEEIASFCESYRRKCDAETKAQAEEIERLKRGRAGDLAAENAELRARCERYEDLILLDEKRAEAGLAHYYRSGADGKCECVVCAEARAIRARREAEQKA